jgi:hypothetical protein
MYEAIPLGVDNHMRCMINGKYKAKNNVYLEKAGEKQCFIGHTIDHGETRVLVV